MGHGIEHDPSRLADPVVARQVAETMQALATPSRLRILACLHEASRSVGDLSQAVGMDPSAVSHQLRVLRHLGLVVGSRAGRRVVDHLHRDDHVGQLLGEAISHVEHLRLGMTAGADARAVAAA